MSPQRSQAVIPARGCRSRLPALCLVVGAEDHDGTSGEGIVIRQIRADIEPTEPSSPRQQVGKPRASAVRTARAALSARRAEQLRAIAALTDDFDAMVHACSDANGDDEHDPEGSTVAFERAQIGALLGAARRELDEIDSAVGRVQGGTYGRCEVCGAVIAPGRLRARPAARRCVGCVSRGT